MLSCGSKFFLKRLLYLLFSEKVPFGFPDHNTRQANQRNQVGDCHQAVQGVSDAQARLSSIVAPTKMITKKMI